MITPQTPLVAIVGFKRSKWPLPGGIRVLTVRDAVVRLLGKKQRVDLDVAVGELTARLTRTREVELRTDSGAVYIYGFTTTASIPDEINQITIRESEGAELIGPAPGGVLGVLTPTEVTKGASGSRQLVEALHLRGVGVG